MNERRAATLAFSRYSGNVNHRILATIRFVKEKPRSALAEPAGREMIAVRMVAGDVFEIMRPEVSKGL
jgi:hypothetical protein